MPSWCLQNLKNWVFFFSCWKKNVKSKKQICTGPPPLEHFFSFGFQREKLPLGDQMEKKIIWGTKGNKKTSFSYAPWETFFSLGPPKEAFFPLWYPKGWRRGGPVQICFLIMALFFNMKKKILNFWEFVSIKIGKSKLDHLGFYCKSSVFW